MTLQPLQRFTLGVVVWLPLMFGLWYLTAAWHLAPVTWFASTVLQMAFPDAVLWLKLENHSLVLATHFAGNASGMAIYPPPANAELLGFHLNPLAYSYGLPLLGALTLATPLAGKYPRLLWSVLLMLPLEAFSILISTLKIMTFEIGEAFQTQQALSAGTMELIALGYQLGTLLLPMLAPILIWVILHRQFLLYLSPGLRPVLDKQAIPSVKDG